MVKSNAVIHKKIFNFFEKICSKKDYIQSPFLSFEIDQKNLTYRLEFYTDIDKDKDSILLSINGTKHFIYSKYKDNSPVFVDVVTCRNLIPIFKELLEGNPDLLNTKNF